MEKKREKIREWFEAKEPKFSVNGFLVGSVLMIITYFFIGFSTLGWVLFILGALIISGVILAYFVLKEEYKNRLPEEQMDKWLLEDIEQCINVALSKLGLEKSDLIAESLVVPGPIYWEVAGFDKEDILRNLGKDNYYRYSVWRLQIFIFTENFLGSYSCSYNWLKNTSINESVNEFFYKDVTSVKMDSISTAHNLVDGAKMEFAQTFQLNLPGDSVKVVVNDTNLKTSSIMTNKVDKAVQNIRAVIRQKKI